MRHFGLCIFTALLFVSGAASAQATSEAWDKVKSYSVDKKEEAVAFGRKLVRAADRDIRELERASAKASDQAKAEYAKEIESLKAGCREVNRKLNAMGKATGTAWDGAKAGFADAWRDLHDA